MKYLVDQLLNLDAEAQKVEPHPHVIIQRVLVFRYFMYDFLQYLEYDFYGIQEDLPQLDILNRQPIPDDLYDFNETRNDSVECPLIKTKQLERGSLSLL